MPSTGLESINKVTASEYTLTESYFYTEFVIGISFSLCECIVCFCESLLCALSICM